MNIFRILPKKFLRTLAHTARINILFATAALYFFPNISILNENERVPSYHLTGALFSSVKNGADDFADMQFTQLTSEEGLSQNSVLVIMKCSQGFMWFGTRDGLNKYDGYTFTVFKPEPSNPYSLSDNTITALLEGNDGSIWIGTGSGGLNRYDRRLDRFIRYQYDPENPGSISSDHIQALFLDRAGQLWIGTSGGGLNRFDDETESFISYQNDPQDPQSLSNNNVVAIQEDRSGTFWIGTLGGGLNRMYHPELSNPNADSLSLGRAARSDSPQTGQPFFIQYTHDVNIPSTLSHNDVYSIYEDLAGFLWIGTGDGILNRFDYLSGEFKQYTLAPGDPFMPQTSVIRVIQQDNQGGIWAGLDNEGLFLVNPSTDDVRRLSIQTGNNRSISSQNIRSIFLDPLGILWLGTYGNGLLKYAPADKDFHVIRHDPSDSTSLSTDTVLSILVDRNQNLWVGTNGGGLNFQQVGTEDFKHYQFDPRDSSGISSNTINAIIENRRGEIWIGTSGGGLARFQQESNTFEIYRHDSTDAGTISDDSISAIFEDHAGGLWIGTFDRGLNYLDRSTGTFVRYLHLPSNAGSLSDNAIHTIYEDRSGNLWIGTSLGLNRYDWETDSFSVFYHNPSVQGTLSDDDILAIYEDHRGELWVGTNGGGLNQFDPEKQSFRHFNTKDGLANEVIYGILGDQRGYLWLSTNSGLSRFNLQTEQFKNYDKSDGLPGGEFSPQAYFKGIDGKLYFGGVNGFISFYPLDIQDDPYIPPIVLTGITQGGELLQVDDTLENISDITLKWPNNYFEFEYAAISYIQPEKNQYAYMLEGFDDDWIMAGTRRSGRYSNLPGGDYTLHIKGSNHDGIWNESGAKIRVRILPPLWERTWFQIGLAVLVFSGVVAGYRMSVNRIQKRNIELEHMVQQRTREVERRRLVGEGLREIMILLNSNRSLGESLDFIVSRATHLTSADRAIIYRTSSENQAEIIASYTRNPAYDYDTLAVEESLARIVAPHIQFGDPVVFPSLARRNTEEGHLHGMEVSQYNALLCVPINLSGEIFGGLALFYIHERSFSNEDTEQCMLIADQAALAIGNAQLRERAQQMAVIGERNRLARDLHDAVTQTLFSASLIAEALPSLYEADPNDGRQLLAELRQLSRGALAEMRTLLLELRPAGVCEANFPELLRQLTEAIAGRIGHPVVLHVQGQGELPPDVQVAFYRVAQEALNNVIKHARASTVSVSLIIVTASDQLESVSLQIVDDGVGFDLAKVPKDRLGLKIMNERAQAISGRLIVDSRTGAGTNIKMTWNADSRGMDEDGAIDECEEYLTRRHGQRSAGGVA